MHLALVLGTTYDQQTDYAPLQHCAVDTAFIADHLGDRLGGFQVEVCEATADLPEYLEDRFGGLDEHLESLLVYFSGYATLRDGKGAALLLNEKSRPAYPISRLMHLMTHAATEALAVLDITLLADSTGSPTEMVKSLIAETRFGPTVGMFAGVDAQHRAPRFGPSRFTDLLLVAFESLGAHNASQITARSVFDTMCAERASYSLIGCASYRPGSSDFQLMRRDARESSGLRPHHSSLPAFAPSTRPPRQGLPSKPLPAFETEEESALPAFDLNSGTPAESNEPPRDDLPPPPEPESPPREVRNEPTSPPTAHPGQSGVAPAPREARPAPREARPAPPHMANRPASLEEVRGRLADPASAPSAVAELVRLSEDPRSTPERRAEALTVAAVAASEVLNDSTQAVRLAFQALEVDRTSRQAFDLAESETTKLGDFHALAALYGMALPAEPNRQRAAILAERLAEVYRTRLNDEARAVAAYRRLLELNPSHVGAHAYLGEMLAKRNLLHEAISHYRAATATEKPNVAVHSALFRLFQQARSSDSMLQAASVLVTLSQAPPPVRSFYETNRVEGLPAARRELTSIIWQEHIMAKVDPTLARFLDILSRPAVEVRLQIQNRKGPLADLEGTEEHEPQKSTTTLARTLMWAARLLDVPVPQFFLKDDSAPIMRRLRADQPASVVSRSLGSGLSLNELAFLWGRHLAYFRPELRLAGFFPNPADIVTLVTAASALAQGPGATKLLDKNEKRLASALSKLMSRQDLEWLKQCAVDASQEQLQWGAHAWVKAAELTATRAGLLCCGDLTIAARLAHAYPLNGVTPPETIVNDLCAFAVSEGHGSVRSYLGVAIDIQNELATG